MSAGTSDLPVAEEAALCAELFGNAVERLYDVGVAGIHRLTANLARVHAAAVLIVAAGMEGALPSVVAGLTDKPVIAVPTSVGYGTAFGGVAALLGMLNSCASGVTVVNIDNGFGAAFAATLINRVGIARERTVTEKANKSITSGRTRRAIEDGRPRLAGRLQLPVDFDPQALPRRREPRARIARHPHPQRPAHRREFDPVARRVHEAGADAFDARGPDAGRSDRSAQDHARRRAADGLCDDRAADPPRTRQAPRAAVCEFRTAGFRRRLARPGPSRPSQERRGSRGQGAVPGHRRDRAPGPGQSQAAAAHAAGDRRRRDAAEDRDPHGLPRTRRTAGRGTRLPNRGAQHDGVPSSFTPTIPKRSSRAWSAT